MNRARRGGRAVAGMAWLGLALAVLTGCGSATQSPSAECADVVRSEAEYAEEIGALSEDITDGTVTDDGTLALRKRAWADVVLGEPECFSAEKVAIALTVLQSLHR
jgi:hypothetical protein